MPRKAKRFEVRFTVRGSGSFPDDMLRYDSCEAATPEDVQWMESTLSEHHGLDALHRELMLKTVVDGPISYVKRMIREKRLPTFGRWASFGWTVTEVYDPKPEDV